ncbi:MAG: hypothetical protein HKN09_03265 [Saprospiraceae bacterium]|nr:hypothetical protein [Saprospiraceae bacterium]
MKKIIVLLFIFCACSSKQDKYVLNYSEEKIKDVLIDVYVISEILDDVDIDVKDSLRSKYIGEIEAIHNIDFLAFERDLEWLQLNPAIYNPIHSAAKDSISSYEKQYKAKKRK